MPIVPPENEPTDFIPRHTGTQIIDLEPRRGYESERDRGSGAIVWLVLGWVLVAVLAACAVGLAKLDLYAWNLVP